MTLCHDWAALIAQSALMKSKSSTIRFLYAASESSADVLYLAGVFVPDAYLSILAKPEIVCSGESP